MGLVESSNVSKGSKKSTKGRVSKRKVVKKGRKNDKRKPSKESITRINTNKHKS
jgi:hypothetical protein